MRTISALAKGISIVEGSIKIFLLDIIVQPLASDASEYLTLKDLGLNESLELIFQKLSYRLN